MYSLFYCRLGWGLFYSCVISALTVLGIYVSWSETFSKVGNPKTRFRIWDFFFWIRKARISLVSCRTVYCDRFVWRHSSSARVLAAGTGQVVARSLAALADGGLVYFWSVTVSFLFSSSFSFSVVYRGFKVCSAYSWTICRQRISGLFRTLAFLVSYVCCGRGLGSFVERWKIDCMASCCNSTLLVKKKNDLVFWKWKLIVKRVRNVLWIALWRSFQRISPRAFPFVIVCASRSQAQHFVLERSRSSAGTKERFAICSWTLA